MDRLTNISAIDSRNQILLYDRFGDNFSVNTGIMLLISLILIFYINEKKKLDFLSVMTLLTSTFSVFFVNLITDHTFAPDRYNFLVNIPEFREGLFIEPIKKIFIFRSSENASLTYSLLPLPSPLSLLDLGLFVKCIYLSFILFIISKNFEKKKFLIYFVIFFPLFHYYSSVGGKECLIIILAYFWSESLIKKNVIINLIFSFLFILIKYEFGFLIAASSLFFFIMQIKFLRKYLILFLIIVFYISSYYIFEKYNYFINYKFSGFYISKEWKPLGDLNEFILLLIKSYFFSPIKILNYGNINLLNIWFSLSLIFAYFYFYLEIINKRKISYEIIFIVLFKIIFCGIYTLMIENWGTYQRLIFSPLIISIFMINNYSIFYKNEK